MSGEPPAAPPRADSTDRPLGHARQHLERLGYRLLEDHRDGRSGAHLLVARSDGGRELVFCELRAERLDEPKVPSGGLRRRRLRRAAHAWLAAHPAVGARTLRFDRLTVFVGDDHRPVGLEYLPNAF
jgi:Holliday junction resolvase-like predicted endonuclease